MNTIEKALQCSVDYENSSIPVAQVIDHIPFSKVLLY